MLPEDEDALKLLEFDKLIEANKASSKEAETASDFDKVKTLQKEFLQLLNKKKEMLIMVRKKYKIVLEGTNLDTVPELTPSWTSMVRKLGFGDSFIRGITE